MNHNGNEQQYRRKYLELFKDIGEEEEYDRNDIIHLDGIEAEAIWLIKKGKVKQVFHDLEGYEKTILILSQGEIFGEITLFQDDKNMVLTQAMESTTVSKIDRDQFLEIISKDPANYMYILKSVTRKFRIIMYQMKDLSYRSIDGRIANLLLRLSEQQGLETKQGKVINLYLTHQEVANMVAATRASVTRTLNKFKKEKAIKVKNKNIIIIDKEKLKKWADK